MFATAKAATEDLELDRPEKAAELGAQSLEPMDFSVQTKLRKLAKLLLPLASQPLPRVVVFGSVGPEEDALWLTRGVAEMLGRTGKAVSLLVVDGAARGPSRMADHFTLEFLSTRKAAADLLDPVEKSLTRLVTTSDLVLVHVNDVLAGTENYSFGSRCAGFVLLARAGHTRRAAMETAMRQIARGGLPVLSAILLDRSYPIPERLYRML